MKHLILTLAIVFSGMLMQAQTDLEIADNLIGRPFSELETRLKDFKLEYYITNTNNGESTLYIVKDNSTRLWEIHHHNVYRQTMVQGKEVNVLAGTDLITEIFVRYKHTNHNDLNDYFAYDEPENSRLTTYEKSLGSKLSHLKLKLNEYF